MTFQRQEELIFKIHRDQESLNEKMDKLTRENQLLKKEVIGLRLDIQRLLEGFKEKLTPSLGL